METLKGAPVQPVQERKPVARLSSMPADKYIYGAFGRYVFMTVQQAQRILARPFDTVNIRLRRLEETGFLGRVQQNQFMPYLYFLSKKGGEEAMRLGMMEKPWYISKKSPNQILHDIGITEIQWRLETHIPAMRARRWKTDLAQDYTGDLMDLLTDFDDSMGWCPWEYVRTNPLTMDKLRDYATDFRRSYFVLPTVEKIERLMQNPMGKVFWQPKNHERVYSILKPES
jgi:hypothetical protein